MSTLPETTLARLQSRAEGGHDDARVLLHLIARAYKRDQDAAEFVDHYSRTIAALSRRLAALERRAVANALLQAEAALAAIAEGLPDSPVEDSEPIEWAETRCAKKALAAIRPVMRRHGIRTSEFPSAVPAPAAPTPSPTAPVGGLVESIARIIASDSSEGPESFQGISKDVIYAIAAWLDTQGFCGSANCLRSHIDR